ncbi:MAG: AAA family ATPase [Thermoflexales bacterium]|nr:AAA family ATPase [Thermoflexales bacterium]
MMTRLNSDSDQIEAVLRDRKAPATVVGGKVTPGFVEYLLRPYPGTKVNALKALRADIALAVGSEDVRIAQQGGHLAVQVSREVETRRRVRLSALMERASKVADYTAVLGLSEDGAPLMARLSAPEVGHVLIAGATGSGKTLLAQSMILSLCARQRPRQLGIIVIDPKLRADNAFARHIEEHLLLPIAHDATSATEALRRVCDVMDRRIIDGPPVPRIVVMIDELADLCMTGGPVVVDALTRIAQRGRESGLHLIVCTQKPSAKAIGPLLKANLPLRLVGKVASLEDARTAAGVPGTGAERLNGRGDFVAVTGSRVIRFQAAEPDVLTPSVGRLPAQPGLTGLYGSGLELQAAR